MRPEPARPDRPDRYRNPRRLQFDLLVFFGGLLFAACVSMVPGLTGWVLALPGCFVAVYAGICLSREMCLPCTPHIPSGPVMVIGPPMAVAPLSGACPLCGRLPSTAPEPEG